MVKRWRLDRWLALVALVVAVFIWGAFSHGTKQADEILGQSGGVLGEALLELHAAQARTPHYDRAEFGERWADVDRNGCDTRNDILSRDLEQVRYRPGTGGCVVQEGVLQDPYTGETIYFERGPETSEAVQIDHVVALSDAWHSGAYEWSAAEREEFANDPLNLLAVDGPANQDKGSLAADGWLPEEESYHCEFVARQIAVKSKWGLAVTDSERQTLAEVLVGCTE